jgi:aspartate aminotransferase
VQIEEAHAADEAANKLNVAVHGFRDDHGNVYRPPTIKHAEKKLREAPDLFNETLPIEGYAPFLELGTRFGYGEDSIVYKNKRIAAIQAMSVTGGLRMAAIFLSRFPATASIRSVLVQTPAAEEDIAALRDGGLDVKMIRFLDHKTGLVDWEGFREDLQAAPPRSAVLLHISGSLPTGADLTAQQWRQLTQLMQEKHLIPLAIMANQGLSSGDTNRDAQPLRFMVHEGLPVVLVQGFDSTMGLYADSPAIVSVATKSTGDRDRVDSQLRNIARALYYHPPAWGARLAHTVWNDARLYKVWLGEINALASRLKSVRDKLYELLTNKFKTPGNWAHIKRTSGMYM